jgi:hypothetical protein
MIRLVEIHFPAYNSETKEPFSLADSNHSFMLGNTKQADCCTINITIKLIITPYY